MTKLHILILWPDKRYYGDFIHSPRLLGSPLFSPFWKSTFLLKSIFYKNSQKPSLRSGLLVPVFWGNLCSERNTFSRAVGARFARTEQNQFSTWFLNSAPFLPVIWHTISLLAKKVGLARPWARPHARTPAKSIFNIIFEFSAVFTCYLTYYKPIAKKDCLARPRARRGCAVRAKWDFFTFMNLFYQYI